MISPAHTFSIQFLTQAFNRGFENYLVPLKLTEQQFADKIALEGVSLADSVVLVEDHQPAGIALLAIRDASGWIAGMGVAPGLRGKGLGRVLMEQVIDNGQKRGLQTILLEVFTNNLSAVRTYQRLGFTAGRELVILDANTLSNPKRSGDVVELTTAAWIEDFYLYHHQKPCWQRTPEVLAGIISQPLTQQFGYLNEDGLLAAMVVFKPGPGNIRVYDIGAQTNQEPFVIPILNAVADRFPARLIWIVNEPEESPLLPVLKSCGFEEKLRQFEMVLNFPR